MSTFLGVGFLGAALRMMGMAKAGMTLGLGGGAKSVITVGGGTPTAVPPNLEDLVLVKVGVSLSGEVVSFFFPGIFPTNGTAFLTEV